MRKRIILFIIPVVALLIMATALVFSTALNTHAAGLTTKPSHTISTPAATKPANSGGMKPNFNWSV